MRLLLVVEAERSRRWMVRLVERLAGLGVEVRLEIVSAATPPERGLELLLDLERAIRHRWRPCGADRIDAAGLAPRADAGFAPDLVIDLGERPRARGTTPVLAVAWDGVHGEAEAFVSLLSAATPVGELVDLATGVVLERALASLEAASGIGGGFEAVAARLVTLIVARIDARLSGKARPDAPAVDREARGRLRSAAAVASHSFASSLVRAIYRLCCHAPHWRVGWRIHDGPGIAETGDLSGPLFKVVPDPGRRFFADPFPVTRDGRTFVFVEDLDHAVGKGLISAIPFDESGPTGPAEVVIEEPWHLSYPFFVEHGGELWMIPESSTAGDVAIYRCARFPDRWERHATLLEGIALSDATVFEENGRWWMFGTLHDGEGGWSDMLVLHSAPSLFGPWTPHPANPVLVDRTSARPAGAFFRRDGRLFRPVQDCTNGYGGELALAEVTRLDDGGYAQVVRDRLAPGPLWPGRKFHTLNRDGRLEVIDGSVYRPKSRWATSLVEARTVPGGAV